MLVEVNGHILKPDYHYYGGVMVTIAIICCWMQTAASQPRPRDQIVPEYQLVRHLPRDT